MKPVTDALMRALMAYKEQPTPDTLHSLKQLVHMPKKSHVSLSIPGLKIICNRWAKVTTVFSTALDDITAMLPMEELDVVPTQEELSKAIDCLACGKAHRNDGIPPEVLKNGKTVFFQSLHELLSLSWEQ